MRQRVNQFCLALAALATDAWCAVLGGPQTAAPGGGTASDAFVRSIGRKLSRVQIRGSFQ